MPLAEAPLGAARGVGMTPVDRPRSASIDHPERPRTEPRTLAPFSARKEPAIDDTTAQRVRAVLALGVVNLFLAAAGVVIGELARPSAERTACGCDGGRA